MAYKCTAEHVQGCKLQVKCIWGSVTFVRYNVLGIVWKLTIKFKPNIHYTGFDYAYIYFIYVRYAQTEYN